MEVIGTSKMLVEVSSDERMSYQPVIAPPNTPITATPPNTPHKSKLFDKMADVSTVSITESFSLDDSPENRRKSVPTGNVISDTMSPDLPQQFKGLKLFKLDEQHEAKMQYNPEKYMDLAEDVLVGDSEVGDSEVGDREVGGDSETDADTSYAQSSPSMPRVKMASPDVSPITSEFNSIEDDDEGRFSDFMKVFGQEQNQLNRFISDEDMLEMEDGDELSYNFEDSKSFLNNVREISYEADESLLH